MSKGNRQTKDQQRQVAVLIEAVRKRSVTRLDLSGKGLTKLPESISQLSQLQKLILYNNHLSEVPESISQLSQLQILNLGGNRLSALPESISQLSQLHSLYLKGNQLSQLPESIGQLSQLQLTYLRGNKLSALPESITQLLELRSLYLDNNQLSALPEGIGQLAQLQQLSLDNNQLSALPEGIGQLSQLRSLYLNNNQLSALPESLRDLVSLQQIYLHRNKGLGLPVEVLGSNLQDVTREQATLSKPSEIFDYYFRVKRPLNEAKLILVGRGAVGKTSLVNQLVHGVFKDEKKTEGIKITQWPIRLHTNEDVQLNVWDFGGQEIMHATHQFFLTERSLYLLVLNGREGGEDADAEYWLKLIESFGKESPVIAVLNKIKEHPFDLNRRGLLQKYPFIVRDSFIRTDCEDGTGRDELRRIIERETDRLEHLRDGFPQSWFSIKDKLARMEKNYLSFDEYRDICAQLGEINQEAQDALAGYLHHLGIALNYKDDPRLQDMHVLNPHWVTNGIYKILNSDKLENQQGDIRLTDLSTILDLNDYPRSMHVFIFDLMKKFELCFNFPDREYHYLIPELLDKQEPDATAEFLPARCLNFQYYYPILPEGSLPRFIVRTHVLSEGLPRWRTGVILKFSDSRALVKADVQDKKVFIHITGESPRDRRELLAIIRSDFERIHRDIRNLQPQAIVPLPDYPDALVPYEELLDWERNGIQAFPKIINSNASDSF